MVSIRNKPNNEYKSGGIFPMLPMEKCIKHHIPRFHPNLNFCSKRGYKR